MSIAIPRRDAAQWFAYEADGDGYVTIERFCKDHWSTFAYLETRAVDHRGIVENARMRVHVRLHREFAHMDPMPRELEGRQFRVPTDDGCPPTRLRDGTLLERHDDFSCAEDMVAAGLIAAEWRVRYSRRFAGGSEMRVRLTAKGQEVAAKLRAHKMDGGSFSNFRLEECNAQV